MAQIITTKKSENSTPRKQYGKKASKPSIPLFRKTNYILMIAGVIVLLAGYIALRGGASADPSQFSEAIFDSRRHVVAPILMLLGLVTEIFAIMWHPCSKKEKTAEGTENQEA